MDSVINASLYINGKSVSNSTGQTFPVINPYDGVTWATAQIASSEDVDIAVVAADAAYRNGPWADFLPNQRAAALRKFGELIAQESERLTRLQVMENGKAIREQAAQTSGLPGFLYYFAGLAETYGGDTIPVSARDTFAYTMREPLGVIACLTPWNSPLALLMWKLAPALAAGNTVVIKPSEVTPISTLELAKLSVEAGIPVGVINVVTGDASTGQALVEHDLVQKIAFTGSTAIGREIGKTAGRRLISASLELGGKSANIVFEDADIDAAIEGVVGGIFAAAGQTCIAGSRVLVHESIYTEFTQKLVARTQKIKLGNPLDWETEVGTISNIRQYDHILTCIEKAKDEGATLLEGGSRAPTRAEESLFILPTIFGDVTPDMNISREEVFGPVVALMKFTDDISAIDIANSSEYGLAAGIWTRDVKRVHNLARKLEAGTVWVNTYRKTNYATPFGGYKDSGIGRENGKHAMDEFTQEKLVWLDLGEGISDPFNPFS